MFSVLVTLCRTCNILRLRRRSRLEGSGKLFFEMICEQPGQVWEPGLRAQRGNMLPPRLEQISVLLDDGCESLSLVVRLCEDWRADVLSEEKLPRESLVRAWDAWCIERVLKVFGLDFEGLEDFLGGKVVVRVVGGCIHVRFGIWYFDFS